MSQFNFLYIGLIRWGIVIHGFIDGYSRLVTGLRASNNNSASTVLQLFLDACGVYGVPSRLRGDHGSENLLVAAWIEEFRGTLRGSYIWGRLVIFFNKVLFLSSISRSVHNVQIERLWVDVTAQVGAIWANHFTRLEMNFGLNINNPNHIWLLQHLFLPTINSVLSFFAQSWNEHKIEIRGGPNRSPLDLFGFDMLVHGVRGNMLPQAEEDMDQEELEVFGIDWEALRDENILESQQDNNGLQEPPDTWLGRIGPPPNLNEVEVNTPEALLTFAEIQSIDNIVSSWVGAGDDESVTQTWINGLATAYNLRPGLF